jgi:hypothetical protein
MDKGIFGFCDRLMHDTHGSALIKLNQAERSFLEGVLQGATSVRTCDEGDVEWRLKPPA